MNQEILDILDALAAQVGESVEHLWPAYVEYIYFRGLAFLVVPLYLFLVSISLCFIFYRRGDWDNFWNGADAPTPRNIAACIAGILAFLGLFVLLASASQYVPMLMSPEGAAIRSILK